MTLYIRCVRLKSNTPELLHIRKTHPHIPSHPAQERSITWDLDRRHFPLNKGWLSQFGMHLSFQTSLGNPLSREQGDSPGAAQQGGWHRPPSLYRGAPPVAEGSVPESRSCHPGCRGIPQSLHSHNQPSWQVSPHTQRRKKSQSKYLTWSSGWPTARLKLLPLKEPVFIRTTKGLSPYESKFHPLWLLHKIPIHGWQTQFKAEWKQYFPLGVIGNPTLCRKAKAPWQSRHCISSILPRNMGVQLETIFHSDSKWQSFNECNVRMGGWRVIPDSCFEKELLTLYSQLFPFYGLECGHDTASLSHHAAENILRVTKPNRKNLNPKMVSWSRMVLITSGYEWKGK